jgi:hypothetical protein
MLSRHFRYLVDMFARGTSSSSRWETIFFSFALRKSRLVHIGPSLSARPCLTTSIVAVVRCARNTSRAPLYSRAAEVAFPCSRTQHTTVAIDYWEAQQCLAMAAYCLDTMFPFHYETRSALPAALIRRSADSAYYEIIMH